MSNKNKTPSATSNPTPAATAEVPPPETPVSPVPPPDEPPAPEGAVPETTVSAVTSATNELTVAPPATTVLATAVPDVMNPDKPFDPFKPGAFTDLIQLFPLDARYLKQTQPVTDDELQEALKPLPAAKREAFSQALERMNPVKLGSHSRRRDALTIFDLRINHGTGNDETRPKGTPEGALYSTDSRIQATGDRDLAAALRAPEILDAYIIIDRRGNTYWPPNEDDTDKAGKTEETEARSRAPLCRSIDGEKGDVFGSCEACPNRPFKNGSKPEEDECRGEIVLYVVPVDFSGVYRFVLNGTNTKAGREIIKKYAPWRENWDHPFAFKTRKEVSKKDSKQRWFIVEADPQRNVVPSAEERAFLRALTRKIDTEVYWVERRRIHLAASRAKPPTLGAKANLAGLLASSQVSASPASVQAGAPPART
jgi:hypothetical protein